MGVVVDMEEYRARKLLREIGERPTVQGMPVFQGIPVISHWGLAPGTVTLGQLERTFKLLVGRERDLQRERNL